MSLANLRVSIVWLKTSRVSRLRGRSTGSWLVESRVGGWEGWRVAVTWFARHVAGLSPLSALLAPEGCPLLRHQQQSPPGLAPPALFCYSVSVLAAPRRLNPADHPTRMTGRWSGTPDPSPLILRSVRRSTAATGPVIKQPRTGQIESVEETRDCRHRGDGQLAATIALPPWTHHAIHVGESIYMDNALR